MQLYTADIPTVAFVAFTVPFTGAVSKAHTRRRMHPGVLSLQFPVDKQVVEDDPFRSYPALHPYCTTVPVTPHSALAVPFFGAVTFPLHATATHVGALELHSRDARHTDT